MDTQPKPPPTVNDLRLETHATMSCAVAPGCWIYEHPVGVWWAAQRLDGKQDHRAGPYRRPTTAAAATLCLWTNEPLPTPAAELVGT